MNRPDPLWPSHEELRANMRRNRRLIAIAVFLTAVNAASAIVHLVFR